VCVPPKFLGADSSKTTGYIRKSSIGQKQYRFSLSPQKLWWYQTAHSGDSRKSLTFTGKVVHMANCLYWTYSEVN